MEPYITFAVAARNDDYGGDFLHRMQVFVNALLALWERHGLNAELVVVEWNPPENRPRLKDALTWPRELKPGTVRIIEVPAGIHRRLPNSDRMPMFEYIAKNVGIRRAQGEYVLATNSDLLFSGELIAFFASQQLSPECFYRVDRYDVDSMVPPEMPVERQLQFCAKHSFRVSTVNGTIPIRRGLLSAFGNVLKPLILISSSDSEPGGATHQRPERLHTNAAGDFFLMATSRWHALRGYPELKSHSFIDGYICFMAASSGLQQRILESPFRVYHQEHDRSEHSKRPLTDYQQYLDRGRRMLEARRPEIFNDENWGLSHEQLPEDWVKT
jgi:hypothetical protein